MFTDQRECPCQLLEISPGDAAFVSPFCGEIGERVVAYIDDIGRVEGVILEHYRAWFRDVDQRLAAQARQAGGYPDLDGESPRAEPRRGSPPSAPHPEEERSECRPARWHRSHRARHRHVALGRGAVDAPYVLRLARPFGSGASAPASFGISTTESASSSCASCPTPPSRRPSSANSSAREQALLAGSACS